MYTLEVERFDKRWNVDTNRFNDKRELVYITAPTKEEAFALFFKKDNSLKYVNGIGYKMLSKKLWDEYRKWLTLDKYASLGGDVW